MGAEGACPLHPAALAVKRQGGGMGRPEGGEQTEAGLECLPHLWVCDPNLLISEPHFLHL